MPPKRTRSKGPITSKKARKGSSYAVKEISNYRRPFGLAGAIDDAEEELEKLRSLSRLLDDDMSFENDSLLVGIVKNMKPVGEPVHPKDDVRLACWRVERLFRLALEESDKFDLGRVCGLEMSVIFSRFLLQTEICRTDKVLGRKLAELRPLLLDRDLRTDLDEHQPIVDIVDILLDREDVKEALEDAKGCDE